MRLHGHPGLVTGAPMLLYMAAMGVSVDEEVEGSGGTRPLRIRGGALTKLQRVQGKRLHTLGHPDDVKLMREVASKLPKLRLSIYGLRMLRNQSIYPGPTVRDLFTTWDQLCLCLDDEVIEREKVWLNFRLWKAARYGQILDLKEAIAQGANVSSSDPGQGGRAAIHWAADGGYVKIVDHLARLGADVMCRDEDLQTPLHLAARSGHVSTIQLLVQLVLDPSCKIFALRAMQGADVNATNSAGFTPLHWASANGFPRAVTALLDYGACVWCPDWQWRTAIQLADYWNQTEVVQILGRAMNLPHDPSEEKCGDWWFRHVTSLDKALMGVRTAPLNLACLTVIAHRNLSAGALSAAALERGAVRPGKDLYYQSRKVAM